jgi:4-amino-4-deoxy-L-arabinose transferase-like glycosyltransferase
MLHYDESMGAADIACIGETGVSVDGEHWPLFTVGAGGGFYTPVYLYFGVLWTRIFGISIAAIRSIPGVFVVLTILGTALLAKRLGGPRAGFWALLLASLSPWGFHFSRVAWDPPVAATFVVWCCYFWLLERPILGGALSGAAFAGAVYSYPPTRMQAPLLFAFLFFYMARITEQRWKRSVSFSVLAVLLGLPLLQRMLDPGFRGRTHALLIFASEHLQGYESTWEKLEHVASTLALHLGKHLTFAFLFLSGDRNRRHSSQFMGELGLLDDFALVLGLCWVIYRLRRALLGRADVPMSGSLERTFVLALVGFFLGLLPAALTNEGLPHALRAIGAWPFVALAGAALLCTVEVHWKRAVSALAGVVALTHVGLYGKTYFVDYPRIARDAFGAAWTQALMHPAKRSPAERRSDAITDRATTMYFLMLSGRYDCDQSRRTATEWASP